MPLDTRIPLSFQAPQFESPLNAYAQISQIKGQQQAQQMNALQLQQATKAMAREEAVRNALIGATTPEDIMRVGGQLGDLGTIQTAIKMQKDQAALAASETAAKVSQMKVARDVLASIAPGDQAAYDLYRQKYDPDGVLPPTLTADVKPHLLMTADNWIKQNTVSTYQNRQLDISGANAAESARHNKVMETRPVGRSPEGTLLGKGYRMKPDGTMEAIPGGPSDPEVIRNTQSVKLSQKDVQAREKAYPKATVAVKAAESEIDTMVSDLQTLKSHPGLSEITGYLQGRVPSVTAFTAKGREAYALYKKILARGGFQKLTDMRQASPTGGALGNVSDTEGRYLREAFGALDLTQTPESLGKAIDDIISTAQATKGRIRESYDLDYEYRQPAAASTETLDYPPDANTPEERDEYDRLMGRKK